MSWYLKVLRQYTVFSGRARRKEYWMFFLFNVVFAVLAMVLDNIIGITYQNLFYGNIYFFYGLAIIIPALAVVVRRLHDIGKSGWWFFISLVPLIGGIWLLVLLLTDSEPGENQYGPNPKETSEIELKSTTFIPYSGFVLIGVAAILQIILDGGLWLEFIFAVRPVGYAGEQLYFISAAMFVSGLFIMNGMFRETKMITVNLILLIGSAPYIIVKFLTFIGLDADFLYGTTLKVTEPLFLLALLIAVIYYYLNEKNTLRLLLVISFGLLFSTITMFWLTVGSDFVLINDYYDRLLTILGVVLILSSLYIIGYSIHHLIKASGNQRST